MSDGMDFSRFFVTAEQAFRDLRERAEHGIEHLARQLDRPLDLDEHPNFGEILGAAIGVPSRQSYAATSSDAFALRRAVEEGGAYADVANAHGAESPQIERFAEGDAVEVWSNSQKKWFGDGIVKRIAESPTQCDGLEIPQGSVQVVFGGGLKWVTPFYFRTSLRMVKPAVAPRSVLQTQVLAAARVAKENQSEDMSDELKSIELGCQLGRCLFTDPDFAPAIGDRVKQLCRPHEIQFHDGKPLHNPAHAALQAFTGPAKGSVDWQLFRGTPHAEDVQQGELGNCWFISSLAALAEFEGGRFVRMLLPGQTELSACGAYLVRLCFGGRWRDIIVDDRFPAIGGNGFYTQLAYCSTSRLQLWASVVEKAFAKACGSYEAVVAGRTDEALTILTGFPCTQVRFDHEKFDPDILWATLASSRDANFLMTCSTGGRDEKEERESEAVGLVPNHAYSLMDTFEVTASSGELVRLLKVRNPHAKAKWRGDWCENSPLWTQSLRDKVGYHDRGASGIFFIAFPDFLIRFDSCTICRIRSTDWHESRIPLCLPSCDIPCAGVGLEVTETAECSISLSQPEERVRTGPLFAAGSGPLACIGFVIVRFDSKRGEEVSAHAVGFLKCKPTVSTECWLQPGYSYLLVPLSFHPGPSLPLVCSCSSSRAAVLAERSFTKEAARAAWAAFARTGKAERFHGAVMYMAKASGGAIVILAENQGLGYFNVDLRIESDPPGYYTHSRGSSTTSDWVASGYGQLLQVALPDGSFQGSVGWHSNHKFQMRMWVQRQAWNIPGVDNVAAGLHIPFKLGT